MVRKGYAGKRKKHHAWLNTIKERCKHSVILHEEMSQVWHSLILFLMNQILKCPELEGTCEVHQFQNDTKQVG